MYKMQFVMLDREGRIVTKWTNSYPFTYKDVAMTTAQNIAKGFNGSDYSLFYRIIQ